MSSTPNNDQNRYFRLAKELLGSIFDLSLFAADRYLALVKIAVTPCAIIFLLGIISLLISESSGSAVFNSLTFLLIGLVALIWFILLIPVFVIGRPLANWAPIKELLGRIGFIVIFTALGAVILAKLPAGFTGLSVFLLLTVMGIYFGIYHEIKFTSRILLSQLISLMIFSLAAQFMPVTYTAIGVQARKLDEQIARGIYPGNQELEMSEAILSGQEKPDPPLFDSFKSPANWWCRQTNTAPVGYRCFSEPGLDEVTREPLTEITPEVVSAALYNLRETRRLEDEKRMEALQQEAAIREQERKQQEQEAAAKAAAEKQARLTEYRDNYIALGAQTPIGYALAFNGSFNSPEAQDIAKNLGIDTTSMLKNSAIEEGVFDRLYSADNTEFDRLGLSETNRFLILGKLEIITEKIDITSTSKKSSTTLDLVLIDALSGTVTAQLALNEESIGYNANLSRTAVWEKTIAALEEESQTILGPVNEALSQP